MPRPLYIICSESGAEDKRTSKFSLFNILEKVILTSFVVSQPIIPISTLHILITVAWFRLDGDGKDFESELVIIRPDKTEENLALFSFSFEDDKPVSRLILEMHGMPDLGGVNGTIWIEGRLRPAGATEWTHRQDYPIIVNMVQPEGNEPE